MKLRIRGDSLRLRLTRGEVERLGSGRSVEEIMHVGPGQALTYAIVPGDMAEMGVQLLDHRVEVWLPTSSVRELSATERVSIEFTQAAGEATLVVLVEKDFQCLAPRGGDEDLDAFPHPGSGHGRRGSP